MSVLNQRFGKTGTLLMTIVMAVAIPVSVWAIYASQPITTNQEKSESTETTQESEPESSKAEAGEATESDGTESDDQKESRKVKVATFGAGCFWCVEAVFQELEGVISVKSGYTGGHVENPTYEQVCSKLTGHVEVCRIEYDPEKIDFKTLLQVFWKTHDPTTPDQQGNDRGPQYRSAIFFHDSEQQELATKYKKLLNESGAFVNPIVTEIRESVKFYPCENYHDNYFKLNPNAGYCRAIIQPKVAKFKRAFADKLKKDED